MWLSTNIAPFIILLGYGNESPRWLTCFRAVSGSFSMGLSKMFVDKVFSDTAKRNVHTMIDEIVAELRKLIAGAPWMSNSTKSEAFVKLDTMKRKVGYPDAEFEEADIERRYENYTMSEDNYYNNQELLSDLSRIKTRASLRKPVDQNAWAYPPNYANAYSNEQANEIAILAGIMQQPFYLESSQDYLNYGAIGYIIGHEITHLFDDVGMQYDAKGNFRNWWAPGDFENYDNRRKCIVKQYSNFYVEELKQNLIGVKAQGEAEADTSGLKSSFRAYKHRELRHGEQLRLPDLNLSQDQLFFLSFAHIYCQKATAKRLNVYVNEANHPPGKYRILGALQNSHDFARVYNCPQGSYMNPDTKCGVW